MARKKYTTMRDLISKNRDKHHGKHVGNNYYGSHHGDAFICRGIPHQNALRGIITAIADYADAHYSEYNGTLGPKTESNVIGNAWLAMIGAARDLLTGQIGEFHPAFVDELLFEMILAQGFKKSDLTDNPEDDK